VSLAKKPWTALSQDAEVGVKWNVQRGCRASHPVCQDCTFVKSSNRSFTMTKQMTPFGVFRVGCGRPTVMHLPSRRLV
jgi:hypothetical protein